MNRPTAFLRTYTHSYDTTVDQVKAAFDDFGFDTEFDTHEFAGPAEILEYVAVSVPVMALLTALTTNAGEDAYLGLKRLCGRILRARREGSHSRDNAVELRDTEGRMRAELPDDLPDAAYRQIVPLFLAYLAQDSPTQPHASMIIHRADGSVLHWLDGSGPRLVWSAQWSRWLAYADAAYAHDLPARRLPPVASRVWVESPAELPALSDQQRSELYRASGSGNSVVLRQRALIALRRSEGVEARHLARSLIVSEELVRAVGHDYVSHGLPGLRPNSVDATPSRIPAEIAADILTMVRTPPRLGQPTDAWTIPSLASFVVDEGVIEDVSHRAIETLLDGAGFSTKGAIERRHPHGPKS